MWYLKISFKNITEDEDPKPVLAYSKVSVKMN